MKHSLGLGVAFSILFAFSALAMDNAADVKVPHHPARHHPHAGARPHSVAPSVAPVPVPVPAAGPYPNGRGGEDGLNRDINKCNEGCIGGNPG